MDGAVEVAEQDERVGDVAREQKVKVVVRKSMSRAECVRTSRHVGSDLVPAVRSLYTTEGKEHFNVQSCRLT